MSTPVTADGIQRLIVRLDPHELGRVEVRIERSAGGPAQVELSVSRPETLQLLLRDQDQLNRALDQAGIPAAGRTVEFQLAPAGSSAPGGFDAAGSDGAWGGAGGQGSRGGRGQQGWRHAGEIADTSRPARAAWRNAGIDITA